MFVIITAKSKDADMSPLTRRYDIADKNDQKMFEASITSIKNKISINNKININDVLLLYASYVYTMLNDNSHNCAEVNNNNNKTTSNLNKKIASGIASLLTEHNVMIGTSEMTNHITIQIKNHNDKKEDHTIIIHKPIKPHYSIGKTTRR